MRPWKRLRVGVFVLLAALGGCGGKESFDDMERTRSAVKSELGVDSGVSAVTMNGHLTVRVTLAATPALDAAAVKSKVTDIVKRNFHGKVEHVQISF